MPITRNSDQKQESLEEFYLDLSENSPNAYADAGKAMLSVLELINKTFKETQIWGLTSVARLVLQSQDDWRSDWYIIISSLGMKEYYFEYLLPPDKQPWDNAYVRGQTDSIEGVKRYLLTAMNECRGWSQSTELAQILIENNIKPH